MNIVIIAKTKGLEYDDRIRKEAIALSKKFNVKIYVNFDNNIKEEGITEYGVPYKSFQLHSRNLLPQSKFLLVKSLEFYLKVAKHIKRNDFIWAHEEYTFLFTILAEKNNFVWDLHEIPSHFISKKMLKVFHFIEKKAFKIIHANNYRIKYLESKKLISNNHKHTFINNFPDSIFTKSIDEDNQFNKFKKWVGNSPYVYLQGLSFKSRYPKNTIESIICHNLKAVVVGNVEQKAFKELQLKYGDLSKNIFFTGMVDQLKIPKYILGAKFSIILYDINLPNNIFCEPNRLYQSIALRVPVITSNNPPMKDIIDKYNIGIALKSDGRNLNEINEAIEQMNINYIIFKNQLNKHYHKFIWDDETVVNIFD